MTEFWRKFLTACLLCQLASAQQSVSNWEGDLGMDMCPECRPLPRVAKRWEPEKSEEDLGADNWEGDLGMGMCPECHPLPRVAKRWEPEKFEEDLGADNWEGDLGMDMCPECQPLPRVAKRWEPEKFEEDLGADNWGGDLGIDMCPECRPLPRVAKRWEPEKFEEDLGADNWEGDLGMDLCPECRPLPRVAKRWEPEKFEEDLGADNWEGDLGMDMCPECRPLPRVAKRWEPEKFEEDQGADMCPECRSLPQPVTLTPENLHEEDLGVDMCPEKGQPMSVGGHHPGSISATDSNTLIGELHQLLKVQQLQIDQLGRLLQQLGKTCQRMTLEVVDLSNEDIPSRRDSSVELFTGEERPERQHVEGAPSLDLRRTSKEQNPASTEIGGILVDGEGHGSGTVGMMVAPYKPSWSEHFTFLSAVKVDGEVSCLHVLPQEGDDGGARYVVGDTNGELYIFLWFGDLLLQYPTISIAPVTAMLSYTLQKTETILVTGHADGAVLVHQILGATEQGSFSKDGRTNRVYSIKALHSLVHPSPESFRPGFKERNNNGDEGTKVSLYKREESVSVINLETFKVGKMRYTIVVNKSGRIQLFRDNGSLHGTAQSPSQPLAFMRNPSAQRLVFLTETGVATLDLRSMQVRSSFCVDLSTSVVMAYAFDAFGRSKAYGLTTEGDLVSVLLRGDINRFECHVKKKRQLAVPGPFAALALKGYLVAATPDQVLVFNTTSQAGFSSANFGVEGPRLLFSVTMTEIALSSLKTPTSRSDWPVMASNRDRFIVLGLGGGYVGVFRSNLLIKSAEFSVKVWNSSILISALALLAIWQLFNRKRDVVLSSSSPAHADSVRLGFGEREKVAEPRRFKSPTRGYVSAPVSFGTSSRSFRPSGVDTGTYSAMREPLFASNQPVGKVEPLE